MSYVLQGFIIGLAALAPIGMQNLFVINTALVQPMRRLIATILIICFFDWTLCLAAFFGVGALFALYPVLKGIVLLVGGAIVIYMGCSVFKTEPSLSHVDTNVSLTSIVITAFTVAWLNPQALIDVTMMFGAIKASIPEEGAIAFLIGYIISSLVWFAGLGGIMHTLSKKIKISHLVWINRICGAILCLYGAKLIYDGILWYIG